MRDDEEHVFSEALSRRMPAERAAFLDQACGGDPYLRGAVESLLAAHERANEFLESPPVGLGERADEWIRAVAGSASERPAAFDAVQPDVVIGDYRLLEQIG